MSREIPQPIRAYVGLAASVLDEARKIPGSLPGLPVRVIGLAMQTALKVQQQWAGLVARGDEVLTGLRGEDEPGLATFDDDVADAVPSSTPPAPSARASAFDRAAADVPDHDEVVETPQDITDQVTALDEGAAPADAEAVLTPEDALESALLEADAPAGGEVTEVDVLTPAGDVETVEATVTDEAVAAFEGGSGDELTAVDESGSPVAAATGAGTDDTDRPEEGGSEQSGSQAAGTAPIEGYDSWTVAQLRGRMRGYQLSTVSDLLAYEESTGNRQPFVSMLRNRLEKLERQAVEASPLAPRGM